MEDESALSIICRACLTETGSFQSIFISENLVDKPLYLSEMMMAFASVQITLGDGLPEQICTQCASDTVKFYKFKLQCEEGDRALRVRLGKSPLHFVETENIKIIGPSTEDEDGTETIEVKPEFCSEDPQIDLDDSIDADDILEPPDDSDIETPEFIKVENEVTGEKQFKCTQCEKLFTKKSSLNRHIKTHTAVKAFECTICNKTFSRQDLLLRHKIAHAMKMEKNISFEDFVEDLPDDAIIIKTEEDLYPCTDCNLLFVKKEELEAHLNEKIEKVLEENNAKVNTEGLSCKVCLKKFTKPSHLNRHVKIHDEKKPYNCRMCNKGFVRAEQLNNHMNMHSGVKPHVCIICLKGFNQISNLKDHMRTHNGEKPFLCSTCGKGFNQLGNLRQHTIRHSGVKAHLCSICGSGFASKGELSAHHRKHTGARPFVCPACGHGFTTSSSLTKHKRIHSGEKPYECEVCKMKFSRSGILARHMRTHTGEKPYVCSFCGKAFSQSNDLTSHLRIHTGEKPYICDACGQAFRQSSALKTHKKTHLDRHIDRNLAMNVKNIKLEHQAFFSALHC